MFKTTRLSLKRKVMNDITRGTDQIGRRSTCVDAIQNPPILARLEMLKMLETLKDSSV